MSGTGWVELPGGPLLIDSSLDDSTAAALADTIGRDRPDAGPYVVNTHAHRRSRRRERLLLRRLRRNDHRPPPPPSPGWHPRSTRPPRQPSPRCASITRRVLGPARPQGPDHLVGSSPRNTAGDLVVYLPKQKVLFAGDLVWYKSVPSLLDPDFDRPGWIASLDSLRSKAFVYEKLVPGHGVWRIPSMS